MQFVQHVIKLDCVQEDEKNEILREMEIELGLQAPASSHSTRAFPCRLKKGLTLDISGD